MACKPIETVLDEVAWPVGMRGIFSGGNVKVKQTVF
jgi:hypothetical protein